MLHSARVIANRSEITISHRSLILGWKHSIPSIEVQSIDLRSGMQSGAKVYHNLVLHTQTGRKLTAGSHIPDKKHAQWLVSQLGKPTGIDL